MTFNLKSSSAKFIFALHLLVSLPALANSLNTACNGRLSSIPENTLPILAANRLPLTLELKNGQLETRESGGGLVAALRSTGEKFLMFGWPGNEIPDNYKDEAADVLKTADPNFDLRPVFFTKSEKEAFYDGFANREIWPIFHGLLDLVPQQRVGWREYVQINIRFATKIFSAIQAEAAISDRLILPWLQDYQLLLVAPILRQMIIAEGLTERVRIGFYLHIPFPTEDELAYFPEFQRRALIEGIAAADYIGVQTPKDAARFADAAAKLGLKATAHVDPVGIDPEKLTAVLARIETQKLIASLKDKYRDYNMLIGVERLDPIKGIFEKLQGYREYLRNNPQAYGKVVLVQVAQPSRMGIPEYQALSADVQRLASEINKEFAVADRLPPVILDENGFSQIEVLAHFAVARAVLINSLRDGMNLVAFETEVVQKHREHPAPLILSQQAGAASWLKGALIIDPRNASDIATAIKLALETPPREAQIRNTRNLKHVEQHTSHAWLQRSLQGLVPTQD